jgi:hypothetical protein
VRAAVRPGWCDPVPVCRAHFGSLDVRITAPPGHTDFLPVHFRVWVRDDDPTPPDVELTVVEEGAPRPAVGHLRDHLELDESGDVDRVTSTITQLVVDQRVSPARAELVVWPRDQVPDFVEHYVVMNLRALLRRLGRFQLHGAAATIGNRTIVLLGDKGSGKSTLSLALARAGGTVLADDQLILHVSDAVDGVRISGVEGALRVTAETERHFFAEPLPYEPREFAGTMKKEVPLRELVSAAPGTDAEPTICYFPRVGHEFAIVPVNRAVALQRILETVTPLHRFVGPSDQLGFVRAITTFVGSVETFDLMLSPDLHDLDAVVATLAPHS